MSQLSLEYAMVNGLLLRVSIGSVYKYVYVHKKKLKNCKHVITVWVYVLYIIDVLWL